VVVESVDELAGVPGAERSGPAKARARGRRGGAYLSWFDGIASGYDVRLQRLGTNGKAILPAAGVLVADRGFSSTQDYGLAANFDGSALLAFRDDRFGGIQITAARIGVDGSAVWGPNGVQLTQTSAFVAAPVIAKAFDLGAFVAWTQDNSVRVQRLDGAGVPQWAQDVVLVPPSGSFSVADMHSDPNANTAVLSIVHQTGGFGSPRRLLAQRIDAAGSLMWSASHVKVFDTGSLQLGSFPDFVPDAGGGGIFSWYDAALLQFQCYAQHILGDGSEAFPHNGVAVSTDTTRVRVSPSASFDPSTGETTLVWREQSSSQTLNGVWAQRLDAAGNRFWTASGKQVVPLGTNALTQASLTPTFWGDAGVLGPVARVRPGPAGRVQAGRQRERGLGAVRRGVDAVEQDPAGGAGGPRGVCDLGLDGRSQRRGRSTRSKRQQRRRVGARGQRVVFRSRLPVRKRRPRRGMRPWDRGGHVLGGRGKTERGGERSSDGRDAGAPEPALHPVHGGCRDAVDPVRGRLALRGREYLALAAVEYGILGDGELLRLDRPVALESSGLPAHARIDLAFPALVPGPERPVREHVQPVERGDGDVWAVIDPRSAFGAPEVVVPLVRLYGRLAPWIHSDPASLTVFQVAQSG
jgi:hypothetical protein